MLGHLNFNTIIVFIIILPERWIGPTVKHPNGVVVPVAQRRLNCLKPQRPWLLPRIRHYPQNTWKHSTLEYILGRFRQLAYDTSLGTPRGNRVAAFQVLLSRAFGVTGASFPACASSPSIHTLPSITH